MPGKLDTISRFSPGNCSHTILESILVGCHNLVDKLVQAVLESFPEAKLTALRDAASKGDAREAESDEQSPSKEPDSAGMQGERRS